MIDRLPYTIGKYVLEELLGEGAQAPVYRARQLGLERIVAVKVIALGTDASADMLNRFEQEARVLAALEHPSILPVYDYGHENGLAYIVMRLASGGSLDRHMKSHARLPEARVLSILESLASALDFAHTRGVIHRDVKPANILLSADGAVWLADFGVSKWLGSQTVRSVPGSLSGTPAYISPDPMFGDAPDGRSDQYSLAVVAYELLSGRRPFDQGSQQDILMAHLSQAPPFKGEWFAEHAAVADVLRRALAKARSARFDTCTEFVAGLRVALTTPGALIDNAETLANVPSTLPTLAPGSSEPSPAVSELSQAELTDTAPANRAPRRWRIALIAAVLLLAAVGYAAVWISDNRLKQDSAPSGVARGASNVAPMPTIPPWTSFPITVAFDDSVHEAKAATGLVEALSRDVFGALQRSTRGMECVDGEVLLDPDAERPRSISSSAPKHPSALSDRAWIYIGVEIALQRSGGAEAERMVSGDEDRYAVELHAELRVGGEVRPLTRQRFVQDSGLAKSLAGAVAPTVRAHAEEYAQALAADMGRELGAILDLGFHHTFVVVSPGDADVDLRELLGQQPGFVEAVRVADSALSVKPGLLDLTPFDGPGGASLSVDPSASIAVWKVRFKAPTQATLECFTEKISEALGSSDHSVQVRRGERTQVLIANKTPKN